MNTTKNRQLAEKLYNDNNDARQKAAKFGMKLTGMLACSIEQIEAHLNLVDEVSAEFGFEMDASKFAVGTSREQLTAAAEAKRKTYKNRAGVRALQAKYGHEAAARIVKNHSGRNIR